MNSPRIKLLAAGFVLVLAVIAAVLVFFISSAVRPAPDAKNIAVQPPVGAAPPTPPVSASAGNAVPAPRVVAHPKAPADAAWNPVASRKGNTLLTAGHTEELLNSPAPKPGDPLPAHLNKIWPKATYIARHDKRAPLGTERVSIIQPASLPYPVRIQEFFPDNSEPVIASEMIADRILVGKPKTMTHENFQRALSLAGARGIQRLTQSGVYQILLAADYTDPDTIPQSIAHYRANFPVAYSEPDFVQRASLVANDPTFADGTLWGLHNTGQNSGTADADIDAPEAWDVRSGSPSIVVAVVDTGVRYTHEDIAANMWVNPGEIPGNGIDDDNNGYIDDVHGINAILNNGNPMDDNKHGSH